MKKRLPKMKNDQAAERILNRDLSDYLTADNFVHTSFEFAPKDKTITLRVSAALLSRLQREAKKRGLKYQRLVREALERYLGAA